MAEVINIQESVRRRGGSSGPEELTPEQRAALQRQAEELERRERAALAGDILDNLGQSKLPPADQEVLASNLSRLIERAKNEGVRKREITHRAGLGDGESSKRLDRYTLPERLKGDLRKKRMSTLSQMFLRYWQLAEATAELANWDSINTVLDLVSGSSFGSKNWKEGGATAPVEYIHLNTLLQKLCRWVVHRSDVSRVWELAEKHTVTGCVGHWAKDAEEHFYNGFEAPSVTLGYLKAGLFSRKPAPDLLQYDAEIKLQSGETYPTRVVIGASVHLCLARGSLVPTLRPFFGFAPALIHLPPTGEPSTQWPPDLTEPAVIEDFSVGENGEILGRIVDGQSDFWIRVTAEEVQRRKASDHVMELKNYREDQEENPWLWFMNIVEANAISLYEIFGKIDPVLINGEWLSAGDTPTECHEPAAAALQRALNAPDHVTGRVRRSVNQSDDIPAEPEGGWPRPVIGPIEELWLSAMKWCRSLERFIEDLRSEAKEATLTTMALYDITSRPSDRKGRK